MRRRIVRVKKQEWSYAVTLLHINIRAPSRPLQKQEVNGRRNSTYKAPSAMCYYGGNISTEVYCTAKVQQTSIISSVISLRW